MTWNCLKLWRYASIEGQGHFLTLTQSQLHMKLKTGFSQKPLGQSKPNFTCKLSGSRKWKFIDMMLVTWPKWLPRPYMVKTLQKSSSLEPVDRFPQNLVCSIDDSCPSWFVQMMTLGWPWPILWRGQIWYLRLFYRKKWKLLIFQNYCSLWPETYWDDEDLGVLKVKVIYIWKLKLAFLRNHLANQSQILYVSFHELGNKNLLTQWWSHYQDGCHAHIW